MVLVESLLLGFGVGLSGALVLGVAPLILSHRPGIALVAGVALVGFGLLTVSGARTATLALTVGAGRVGPFFAGVLTSVANAYFWLWWATLGGALLAGALALGPGNAAFYLAGHGMADVAWLLLVGACGIALVAIGVAYTATAF